MIGPVKLCISLSRDGLIKAVGPAEAIHLQYSGAAFDKVIDAKGMCVLPGEYLFILFMFNYIRPVISTLLLQGWLMPTPIQSGLETGCMSLQ